MTGFSQSVEFCLFQLFVATRKMSFSVSYKLMLLQNCKTYFEKKLMVRQGIKPGYSLALSDFARTNIFKQNRARLVKPGYSLALSDFARTNIFKENRTRLVEPGYSLSLSDFARD